MSTDTAMRPTEASDPTRHGRVATDDVRPSDDLTDEILAGCPALEQLIGVLSEIDRLNASAVALVDRLQASGEVESQTGLPLELWLSIRGRQVRSDRRMLGTAADVLRWLPSLRHAFARGAVAWGQVRAVVLAVSKLPSHLHDAIDAELAAAITALGDSEPDALLHAVRRATQESDPAPDDRDEQRAVRERFIALQPRLDGSGGTLYGEFDPTGFAVLDAWFATGSPPTARYRDHVGEEGDRQRRDTSTRELGRQRADQLIGRLARDLPGDHDAPARAQPAALSSPSTPAEPGPPAEPGSPPADAPPAGSPTGDGRPRPTLLLRLPYASLLGGDVPGELLTTLTGGRLRLSARASRELVAAGGADLRTIVVDGLGEVLGVGRRTRVPPGWLRDAVLARDANCAAPGCQVAARRCQLDHAQRWQDGGSTDVANLSPLCATDNHARERDGWDAVGAANGTRRWRHRRSGLEVDHVPDTWRPPPPDPTLPF